MTWGFPLVLKGKSGQPLKPKPVNNAREDKLGTAFWRASFERRRCLIPVTAWAEAEGAKGAMTRTWYSLAGEEVFAVAGVWRPTEEWGQAYSMVMVDGCPQMADVHDRMPVVLARTDWEQWLAGTPAEAFALCQTVQANLRSTAPPSAGRPAAAEREGRGLERGRINDTRERTWPMGDRAPVHITIGGACRANTLNLRRARGRL
jgi:putative SOS response-associated peptidase YedK